MCVHVCVCVRACVHALLQFFQNLCRFVVMGWAGLGGGRGGKYIKAENSGRMVMPGALIAGLEHVERIQKTKKNKFLFLFLLVR